MPERIPRTKKGKQEAVHGTMHEFKHGKLHSGSKKGPIVKSRAQAVAIALKQSGQSKYDRSSHHKGNPGFPSSETGGSPPPRTYREHEAREQRTMGAGYGISEYGSYQSGPRRPPPRGPDGPRGLGDTHAFRVKGQQRAGNLRMSGHPRAHRVGHR